MDFKSSRDTLCLIFFSYMMGIDFIEKHDQNLLIGMALIGQHSLAFDS